MKLPGHCRFIDFIDKSNHSGSLVVIEKFVPFSINRLYYLFNQETQSKRGFHAHKKLEQIIFAIHGSLDIILDDGILKQTITLDNPRRGVYISPMIWRELLNFSPDSVCLVLASDCYDEDDYIRNYEEFLSAKKFA